VPAQACPSLPTLANRPTHTLDCLVMAAPTSNLSFYRFFSICETAHFRPGTDVMIFKIISPKKSAKKLAFLTRNNAIFFKNDHNIGF
jgi:hypothetical protein